MPDPRRWRTLLAAALVVVPPTPLVAQTAPPARAAPAADPALTARIATLVDIIAGTGDFDAYFTPAFRAQVPKDKWTALIAQVTAQLGKPLAIAAVDPASPLSARVRVRFERGILNVQLSVTAEAPHQVGGLLITGAEMANDSIDKLTADFRALPGGSAFTIAALADGAAPRQLGGINATAAAPLGSAFKLWVLGDLVRAVNAGERRWTDVVPVGTPSLPSGVMQGWPAGSPVTLHTLAVLMISISDNTATDTLVTLAGARLDRYVAAAGAPGLAPMLTTRQMFAIKSAPNADLAARWAATPQPAARRALLDATAARLARTAIDVNMFNGKPVAIDTLEWFASPAQTAAVLDRLRGDANARAILAVNPGVDATTAARFAYVGFKGGSEPGVITLNYVVQRKDGRWLAVAGNWHRADAGVDTLTFTTLMARALVLASELPLD